VPKRQAYPGAALTLFRWGFGGEEPLVVVDPVQPFRICLWAHDEHGVMGQRDALYGASWCRRWHGRRCRCPSMIRVTLVNLFHTVLLQPESHHPLCPNTDIDNLGTADHVDRLVGMFRYVVCAGAVVLDKDVVDRVVEHTLDMGANESDGGGEGAQRWRFVRWVAVDGETTCWLEMVKERLGKTCLPSSFTSPSTATNLGTSPPVISGYMRRTEYWKVEYLDGASYPT